MIRKLALGLILLCLLVFEAACSGKQPTKIVEVPTVVRPTLPMHYLEPTPVPDCDWCETNGDLWECYEETRRAVESANKDKQAFSTSVEQQE